MTTCGVADFMTSCVKFTSSLCVLLSLQIVMAGKGTSHSGVDCSANDTMTGRWSHLSHTWRIRCPQAARLRRKAASQHNLR